MTNIWQCTSTPYEELPYRLQMCRKEHMARSIKELGKKTKPCGIEMLAFKSFMTNIIPIISTWEANIRANQRLRESAWLKMQISNTRTHALRHTNCLCKAILSGRRVTVKLKASLVKTTQCRRPLTWPIHWNQKRHENGCYIYLSGVHNNDLTCTGHMENTRQVFCSTKLNILNRSSQLH